MTELSPSLVLVVTLRTLAVCGGALLLALAFGLPVGIWLGRKRFRGRMLGISLVNSGMGAPPVVVGLLVSMLFWRQGPLGFLGWMYSPRIMVLAQVAIASAVGGRHYAGGGGGARRRLGAAGKERWALLPRAGSGCCCARFAWVWWPR